MTWWEAGGAGVWTGNVLKNMSDILPWQVKRLVVVQVIQVFPGPSDKGVGIIQQDIWLPRHVFHLKEETKSNMSVKVQYADS